MPSPLTPFLFEGVYARDLRGDFSKPFGATFPVPFAIDEIFWSTSARGVVRGLHFQLPSHPIGKIVWVSRGSVLDVAVDLRDHERFGEVTAFELDAAHGHAVFIPEGFAHGFQALEDDTIVNYAQRGDYDRDADAGIRWDSAGIDWPLPVGAMSDRDRSFGALADYADRFAL